MDISLFYYHIIMKKIITIALMAILSVGLVSCGTQAPLTESQQAEQYGLSLEEYKQQKDAAARMNMTIEDHLKMGHDWDTMDHSTMDMSDDSHMIEDDSEMMSHGEMTEDEKHMKEFHDGEEVDMHGADEHR